MRRNRAALMKPVWENVRIDWDAFAGMTSLEIANAIGVHETTVKDWKRRDGVQGAPTNQQQKYAEHGTRARYVHEKCRCQQCVGANTAYQRKWREKR